MNIETIMTQPYLKGDILLRYMPASACVTTYDDEAWTTTIAFTHCIACQIMGHSRKNLLSVRLLIPNLAIPKISSQKNVLKLSASLK